MARIEKQDLACPHCGKPIALMGTKEATEFLGISASSFQNLRQRDDFPAARAVIGQGGLWLQEDLEEFRQSRSERVLEKLVTSLSRELGGLSSEEREKVTQRLQEAGAS